MCYVYCAWVRVCESESVCWGFCCVGTEGKKRKKACGLDSGGDRIYLI